MHCELRRAKGCRMMKPAGGRRGGRIRMEEDNRRRGEVAMALRYRSPGAPLRYGPPRQEALRVHEQAAAVPTSGRRFESTWTHTCHVFGRRAHACFPTPCLLSWSRLSLPPPPPFLLPLPFRSPAFPPSPASLPCPSPSPLSLPPPDTWKHLGYE